MDAVKRYFLAPVRAVSRFCRAVAATTAASDDADAFHALWAVAWEGGDVVSPAPMSVNPAVGIVQFVDTTEVAVVSEDGALAEMAPSYPENFKACDRGPLGRRASAFKRYWVARVHEQYPRVVGNWDDAALACTRIFLCKAMREPRDYYVTDVVNGRPTKRKVHRLGMTTTQIAECVDWIVTAAHIGTPAQAMQREIRRGLKPNWLMRVFGVHDYAGSW